MSYVFSCRASNGAICTLPEGSSFVKLANLESVRQYACQNANSWYRYINGPRGRGAENGSIYLVTACEKTEAWGMAAFQDVIDPQGLRISFGETGNSDLAYDWVEKGPGEAKSGCASFEYVDGAPCRPRNQCMFIQGFKIALGQGVWATLLSRVEISRIENGPHESRNATRSSGAVPFRNQSSWLSRLWSFPTWGRTVSNTPTTEDHPVFSQSHTDESSSHVMSISAFPLVPKVSPFFVVLFYHFIINNHQDVHPSKIISEYLLRQVTCPSNSPKPDSTEFVSPGSRCRGCNSA